MLIIELIVSSEETKFWSSLKVTLVYTRDYKIYCFKKKHIIQKVIFDTFDSSNIYQVKSNFLLPTSVAREIELKEKRIKNESYFI